MPLEITGELYNDQSNGLQPASGTGNFGDIEYFAADSPSDLESIAPEFYNLLFGAGLLGADGTKDTFAENVGVAASDADFVSFTNGATVTDLFFSKNAAGDPLDGQVWTYNSDNVTTIDGDLIYIYSINDGQVMIASTEAGLTPDDIGDFDSTQIVAAAYLDPNATNTQAAIYLATFQAISHFDPTNPNDVVDLADNLWVSATTSQEFFFNQLVSNKFLFGVVGDPVATERLVVIGEGYVLNNAKPGEQLANGGDVEALNTSQGGELPGNKDVATIGIDNQMLDGSDSEGIFLMLTEDATPMTPGAYQDGTALSFDSVKTLDNLGVTITQTQGNTAASMRISGYLNVGLTSTNAISFTDKQLGRTGDIVLLDKVEVFEFPDETTPVASREVGGALVINDPTRSDITITFFDVNNVATNDATKAVYAVVTGLADADTVVGTWDSDINHMLSEAVTGAYDIGRVVSTEGGLTSANVGEDMFVVDDAPVLALDSAETDVNHDETPGIDTGTGDDDVGGDTVIDDPDGIPGSGDELVIADLFNGVTDAGNDPDVADGENDGASTNSAIGFARSGGPLVVLDLEDVIDAAITDYGTDGESSTAAITYALKPGTPDGNGNVDSGLQTTEGETIYLLQEGDLIVGRIDDDGDPTNGIGGAAAFAIAIDSVTGEVFTAQWLSVLHGDSPDNHDEIATLTDGAVLVEVKIRDGDEDPDTESLPVGDQIGFGDDGPEVTVSPDIDAGDIEALALNHDETIDPDGNATPGDGEDNYNDAETESGGGAPNGDDDDTGVTSITVATSLADNQAIGFLSAGGGGEIGALFGVTEDYGSDGEGDLDTSDGRTDQLSLVLSSSPLETNLVVTALAGTPLESMSETERTVWLVQVSATVVEGVIAGADGIGGDDTDEFVAFRITLTNPTDLATAELETRQFLAIDHDLSEEPDGAEAPEDPSLFDEEVVLSTVAQDATVGIRLSSTIEDGDDDTDTDDATVTIVDNAGGFLSFDDDGPKAAIRETGVQVLHDETPGEDTGSDDEPLANLPAAFAALGTAIGWALSSDAVVAVDDANDFGTDDEHPTTSTRFSLAVSAEGVDSGLVAIIDPTTGDTASVLLYAETVTLGLDTHDVIVGRIDAGDADPTDDPVAIAIVIDPDTGVLSVAQYLPMLHLDGSGNPISIVSIVDAALLAVLTTMDGDQDVSTDSVPIGDAVRIRDDEPGARDGPVVPIEEDDLDNQVVVSDVIVSGSTGLNEDGSTDAHTSVDLDLEPFVDPSVDRPLTFGVKAADTTEEEATEAALATANSGLQSKGETVAFDVNGTTNTITGYVESGATSGFQSAEDRTVFTWSVTEAGLATFTAADQLDHGTAEERDESNADDDDQEETVAINLTAALSVLDRDKDPVSFSAEPDFLQYAVEDDMPDIGDSGANDVAAGEEDIIPNAVIDFAAPGTADEVSSKTVSLEARIGTDENDAGDASVTITSHETEIVYGTDLHLLAEISQDLQTVSYYEDVNGNDEFDAGDIEYFRLSIDDTDPDSSQWTYTWQGFQAPPPAFLEFDLGGLPSNQSLFGMIPAATSEPDGLALLILPQHVVLNASKNDGTFSNTSGTINSSQGGGGTTIGVTDQMFDGPGGNKSDAGAYFVFVIDPDDDILAGVSPDLSNVYDDADNIGFSGGTFNATSAEVEIVQNSTSAVVRLTAIDLDEEEIGGVGDPTDADDGTVDTSGRSFAVDPTATDDLVNINEIKVWTQGGSKSGTLLEHVVLNNDGTSAIVDGIDSSTVSVAFVSNGDGTYSANVSITQKDSKYVIQYFTEGDHDTVGVVSGGDTSSKFDIGGFNVTQARPMQDQALDWEVTITDFDGDTDVATFSTGIDGSGEPGNGGFDDDSVTGVGSSAIV